ncbi:MAG: aspartate/glutamate racemase family protein [Clostridiales bacterium]|nr:MAG: aspartate/glutamate racemase family protein [Clostridiales bacterium]
MHKIGILDSGIGGLTICSYVFRVMPDVNILYYADTLNAPYGSKSRREVYAAVKAGVSYLFDAGCDEVVIACNTATTTCIGELRGEFSKPIIGTEPELKNALSGAEKPLLLATPLTYENIKNDTFETADTTSLSKIIEESVFCEKIRKDIACALVSESRKKVVLGCTHYLYLEKNFFVLQNVRRRTGSRKQGEKRRGRKLSENPSRRQFVYCVFGKEKFHKISDGVFGFRRIQPKQSRTIKFVIQKYKKSSCHIALYKL